MIAVRQSAALGPASRGETVNLNFKQIEAFVMVADLGSFRQAAERLNTTQPNISTRISNLEEMIGAKVMERDAGSVRLTAKGRELLEEARHIIRSAEKFIDTAGHAHLTESTIKLGVTEMIVHTWLPDWFRSVNENYPNLKVELTVDMSADLKPLLHSRSIDMAFQNGPFARQMSGSEKLGRFPYVWVGAPGLKITRSRKPGTDEMLAQTILSHGKQSDQYQQIETYFSKHSNKAPNIAVSNTMAPCVHMAVQGMGVSALPAAIARPYITNGSLSAVKFPWVPKPLDFFARYDAQTASSVVIELAKMARETSLSYQKN